MAVLGASSLVAMDRSTAYAASADNNRWSVNNGLRLSTATVTNDLHSARNTLTHRTRYGIFNYATQALGGTVTVSRFELTTP